MPPRHHAHDRCCRRPEAHHGQFGECANTAGRRLRQASASAGSFSGIAHNVASRRKGKPVSSAHPVDAMHGRLASRGYPRPDHVAFGQRRSIRGYFWGYRNARQTQTPIAKSDSENFPIPLSGTSDFLKSLVMQARPQSTRKPPEFVVRLFCFLRPVRIAWVAGPSLPLPCPPCLRPRRAFRCGAHAASSRCYRLTALPHRAYRAPHPPHP